MKLRSAIERLELMATRLPRSTLVEQPLLSKTNRVLERTYLEGGSPPELEDLANLAEHIIKNVHANQLDEIPRRDWRRASWCLWLKQNPLARDKAARTASLAWLKAEGSRRAYGSLIANYLRSFEIGDQSFVEIGQHLAEAVMKFDWPWRDRHKRFHIFTPPEAPKRIAENVLGEDKPLHETLHNMGLLGDLAYAGLGSAAYKVALEKYRDQVGSSDNPERFLDRILDWGTVGQEFAFGGMRGWFANCLLYPWTDPSSPPNTKIIDRSRDSLLKQLQDPRLHPARWNDVDDEPKAVMKRWLAKASLEQFFQIVDDVASPEFRTHWPFRRPFWEAYDRLGVIDEAWVAFADQGASRAKTVFEGNLSFGRLDSAYNVQSNHVVLLLKLGPLRVAEWSENGKCYIWLPGNGSAPTLYRQRYTREDVINGSDNGGVTHSWSKHGSWQRRVSDFIHQHTGISIRQSDFMPKGWSRYG